MARFKVTVPDHPPEHALLCDVLVQGAVVKGLDWTVCSEQEQPKKTLPFVLRNKGVYVQEFAHVYAAVNWIFACLPGVELEVIK